MAPSSPSMKKPTITSLCKDMGIPHSGKDKSKIFNDLFAPKKCLHDVYTSLFHKVYGTAYAQSLDEKDRKIKADASVTRNRTLTELRDNKTRYHFLTRNNHKANNGYLEFVATAVHDTTKALVNTPSGPFFEKNETERPSEDNVLHIAFSVTEFSTLR